MSAGLRHRAFASVAAAVLTWGAAPLAAWVAPHSAVFRGLVETHLECGPIAARLASVSLSDCLSAGLEATDGRSVRGRAILMREVPPAAPGALGRVLLFGGIHGDELSSVSVVFGWIAGIDRYGAGAVHWRIVPALNPDGLVLRPASRMNARGVDLNRNFPSPGWRDQAHRYWRDRTGGNPRRYPGPAPLSEPESLWLSRQIDQFRPHVIVAVHAPLEVLDFDGPPEPPERLGSLRLELLGTYPGSLGRYAGVYRGIPVVTIELPHAGIMPSPEEQRQIWSDLEVWLERRLAALPTSTAATAR